MTLAKSSATLEVMTTWTHAYAPAPWHTGGTGEPGRLTAGELMLTLLVNPEVALQGSPATSNHVVVKPVAVESQPLP